ncbi:MAG: peptidoglycan DD-metalloendopeptidase family protein [Caldilineaceae bacterium]|nr:peptidoglycan DD-metalloendopeptidase family protein [Caldilineaceae bacterium]
MQTQQVAAQSPGDTYVVKTGDTLASIAANLGIPLELLVTANQLTDVDALDVGQVLQLPRGATRSALVARPGDTISAIALREGLSVPRLAILNHTTPSARLFPGQQIRLLPNTPAAPTRFGSMKVISVPLVVVQGQAGWVEAVVDRPLALEAGWNGAPLGIRPLAILKEGEAGEEVTVWGGYVPTAASMEPGVYPVSLSYRAANGVKVTRSFPVFVQEQGFPVQEITLPPDKNALIEQEVSQDELDYLAPVWTRTATPIQWRGPFELPLSVTAPTTSAYGVRRNYNSSQYFSFHTGQDFAAPGGSLVHAPGDGIVALAEPLTVRGISVILDHGAGLFTGYWHLQEALVTPGETVRAGDPIGLVGTTGRSTGEHLHWELRIYGIAVDPMPFLTQPLLAVTSSAEQASDQGTRTGQ